MVGRDAGSALCRLWVALVVTVSLMVGPWSSAPADAAQELTDGGFEAATGNPLDSPAWAETDSRYGSPLCTEVTCGAGNFFSGPHSGSVWAWFGGPAGGEHTASLSQAFTVPEGPATLSFWFRVAELSAPDDATLTVAVDGAPVLVDHEPRLTAYVRQEVVLTGVGDRAPHTLSFEFHNPSGGAVEMDLDDVSITALPDTRLTTAPTGGVARSLTVPLAFASDSPSATFRCSLDGAQMGVCVSPLAVTISPGPHTFQVTAVDADGSDPSPATVGFIAYDCPVLDHVVAVSSAKAIKAKARVTTTRHRLHAAAKAGNQPKARQLRRKLHRLEKKLTKARARLHAAQSADQPCHS